MPLVRSIARRYTTSGEPLEDLVQVGTVGLLKAVDRFEPGRGKDLRALAAPTIEGEIRHHLRDHAQLVRTPERVRAQDGPVRAVPLEAGATPVAPPDAGDERALIAAGLELLSGRERRIIELRYFEDLRQADIAERLGISQAQVSRLIKRALETMRAGLQDGATPARGNGGGAAPRPPRDADATASHSGRLLVRMDPALHDRLARAARRDGVSLNAYITGVLDRAGAEPPRRRTPSTLLLANLAVVAAALIVGVVLLVLALERGW